MIYSTPSLFTSKPFSQYKYNLLIVSFQIVLISEIYYQGYIYDHYDGFH